MQLLRNQCLENYVHREWERLSADSFVLSVYSCSRRSTRPAASETYETPSSWHVGSPTVALSVTDSEPSASQHVYTSVRSVQQPSLTSAHVAGTDDDNDVTVIDNDLYERQGHGWGHGKVPSIERMSVLSLNVDRASLYLSDNTPVLDRVLVQNYGYKLEFKSKSKELLDFGFRLGLN